MRYSVKVKLNKDFLEIEGDQIIVGIKSKPERGRANEELISKISRYFKVLPKSVHIVSGRTARKKIVEIL